MFSIDYSSAFSGSFPPVWCVGVCEHACTYRPQTSQETRGLSRNSVPLDLPPSTSVITGFSMSHNHALSPLTVGPALGVKHGGRASWRKGFAGLLFLLVEGYWGL